MLVYFRVVYSVSLVSLCQLLSDGVSISTFFFFLFSYNVGISLLDYIPVPTHICCICFPTYLQRTKDKLRHITIFKVYWSKNQLELGNAKLEMDGRFPTTGSREETHREERETKQGNYLSLAKELHYLGEPNGCLWWVVPGFLFLNLEALWA